MRKVASCLVDIGRLDGNGFVILSEFLGANGMGIDLWDPELVAATNRC